MGWMRSCTRLLGATLLTATTAALGGLTLPACVGRIGDGEGLAGTPSPSPGIVPRPQPSPGTSPSPSPTTPPTPTAPVPLPAGIRRLTQRELVQAVEALLPGTGAPLDALPDDTRQSDFTRNRAQIVDPIFAGALETLAREAARDAVEQRWARVVPCARGTAVDAACVDSTLRTLGERAFRRPLEPEVLEALRAVYTVGVTEGDAQLGMRLVLEALLQSPSFVYARELGGTVNAGHVRLSGPELAEALALLLTGEPPDAALLSAAAAGTLDTASGRATEARRLYTRPAARAHLARALLEWLHLDVLGETAKDATAYPGYFALRPAMEAETEALAERAVAAPDTLAYYLGTTEAELSPELAAFYGAPSTSRVDPRRPGVLSRAAFLAVYASPTESSPVRRGNALLKRLLCTDLPLPIELMIQIVPPVPDPRLTTRQRYAQHSSDATCAGCHTRIDPLGFAFEGFDGIGQARSTENGQAIDARVQVTAGTLTGEYADHVTLISRLAADPTARACFARHVLRFAAATRQASLEDPLVDAAVARGGLSLLDVLLTYVESDSFATRTTP